MSEDLQYKIAVRILELLPEAVLVRVKDKITVDFGCEAEIGFDQIGALAQILNTDVIAVKHHRTFRRKGEDIFEVEGMILEVMDWSFMEEEDG